MNKKHVYQFGPGGADGDGKMKETLGGKGAGLAEMCRANLPVPPGFTISTDVCNIYFQNQNQVPGQIHQEMLQALRKLEKQMGQKLGDTGNPLLVSVRSGAKFSMPGMMEIFDFNVYAMCSDGDLMEGVGSEAASLAAHLKLSNLVRSRPEFSWLAHLKHLRSNAAWRLSAISSCRCSLSSSARPWTWAA